MEVKICKQCNETKPISEFHINKHNKDGHRSVCRTCISKDKRGLEYARKYKAKHREKIKENDKKYRAGEEYKFRKSMRKANARGSEGRFSIVQWKVLCLYYGNKCMRCGSVGNLQIDHVVSITRGGKNVISNIQPLCPSCNKSKNHRCIDYRPDKGEFARILQLFSL